MRRCRAVTASWRICAQPPAPADQTDVAAIAQQQRPSPQEDIRDIRGPKHIPSPGSGPPGVASGLALAGAWIRRLALESSSRSRAGKLPYEIALDRLEEARALMQPENAREFSIAVSEIVRHYIEDRFQVWAARRTTEEFLHDLLNQSDTRSSRRISRCWRIFSITATWPSSPAGFSP